MMSKHNEIDVDLGVNDSAVVEASLAEISDETIDKLEKAALVASAKSEVFPWELALETYDSTFPNYTPSRDALDFFNLMRLVQGSDFTVGNSLGQYFMVDLTFGHVTKEMYPYSKEVQDTIVVDQERIAMCCSRGVSKSTIITCFLPIYVAIKGELPNAGKQYFWALLGASARGHGRVMAKGIEGFAGESKFLKSIMEDMHFTETEAYFVRSGVGPASERTFTIKFGSAYSPIRGIKDKYGHRLCGALLDDVIPTSSAAYSPVIMSTLETALYADIANALKASGGIIINVFTPFWVGDPCTKSIINKAFTPFLLPIAEKMDDESVNLLDVASSWPEMHTQASIHKMWNTAKKAKMMKLFQQERQLQLVSGQDRLIPDSALQWTDMKLIADNIGAYTVLITTDYTTTSGEKSDFSGVATWAISNNDDWFLLNITLCKRSIPEQYAATLDEAAMWKRKGKHVEIGVEIDGGQGSHVYGLEQAMGLRGDYYTFAKDINDKNGTRKGILSRGSGVKKHERFRVIAPRFLQGKVWLPEHLKEFKDMKEFIQQIKGITHEAFTRADDGPDLVSQLGLIKYYLPTVEMVSNPNMGKDSIYNSFYDNMNSSEPDAYESY